MVKIEEATYRDEKLKELNALVWEITIKKLEETSGCSIIQKAGNEEPYTIGLYGDYLSHAYISIVPRINHVFVFDKDSFTFALDLVNLYENYLGKIPEWTVKREFS